MEAKKTLTGEGDLIEESHFSVRIRVCPACKQRFLSVFTETIDWDDGDDPQYLTVLPLTAAEAAELILQASDLTEATLDALGTGRKSLHYDHPKGREARIYWGMGIMVGHHD
jgi:hypothetical protein